MKNIYYLLLFIFIVLLYPNFGRSSNMGVSNTIIERKYIYKSKGDTLKDDSLKTVKLQEVVVQSKQKIHGLEKDIYIPTMSQKQISADGYDLLRNMAIPQLDINILTNSVQVHGKAVTFVVDGHIITNPNDLKQIQPCDVIRVEYNDMPSGEYAKFDCIVAFTTKRKDKGGNIMINGLQGLNKDQGNYDATIRGFYKRSEHTLTYSENYLFDNKSDKNQTEDFIYPNGETLLKTLQTNTSFSKEKKSNLFYNYHYYGDSLTLNARLGYLFKSPKAGTNYLTTYEGKLDETFNTDEQSIEKSYSPYLAFSGNLKLRRGQRLSFRGSLDYSNNRYDYLLREGSLENSNDSKEHYYRLVYGINYTKQWQKKWDLTASLFNFTEKSHTNYLINKEEENDRLKYSETLYQVGISKRWERLFVSLNGGFSQLIYRTGDQGDQTVYSPRIRTTLKYTVTPRLSIQYRGEVTNSAPTMDLFNSIEQKIDKVQKRRGNPNMSVTHIISNLLNVNYDIASWSFYFTYDMFISWKNNGEIVSYENDYFIHSYLTEGHYYYTNPEIGLSYSNHGLLFKTKFGAEHYQVTGKNSITDTEWYNKSTVSYTLKSLNLGLYYTTYQRGVYASLLKWSHSALYGMTASYNYKGLSVMLGVQNPFTEYRTNKVLLNDIYVKHQQGLDCLSGKYLFIKFSYSLNFGNKDHSYINTDSNKSMNSAIMKSGVSN